MKRLKIAVVTPELPNREYPNRGGPIYQTLLHLCEDSDLKALCPLPRYPAHFQPLRYDYRHSDLRHELPGVPVSYFEYPAFPMVSRPFNGLTCAHYLEPHLRAFDADVILNFWLYPAGFAALTVGRKLHVPVIVGSIGSDLNAIPDPFSRWLTRKTLTGAARVIVKSEQLRVRALAMGGVPDRTHVVPNGCDDRLFFVQDRASARQELKIPALAELIVFVGRIHPVKAIEDLLAAVSALIKKRPNLRLVCVGDGPELESMREKVRAGNFDRRVTFAGACDSIKVARWLAAANLLALPSHAEGCPNVVIEALSCGRPVVATSVGALPELVDRACGILIPPRNVAALTNALDSVLIMPWDENAIAKRFRRSWQQVAQEVLTICQAARGDLPAQFGCN